MRNFSARVPAAGVLAGLVCLILATGPAFAHLGLPTARPAKPGAVEGEEIEIEEEEAEASPAKATKKS